MPDQVVQAYHRIHQKEEDQDKRKAASNKSIEFFLTLVGQMDRDRKHIELAHSLQNLLHLYKLFTIMIIKI